MSDQTIEIECLSCDKYFETSKLKREGDTFRCPHCNHKHEADTDINEDGDYFWFVVNARKQ